MVFSITLNNQPLKREVKILTWKSVEEFVLAEFEFGVLFEGWEETEFGWSNNGIDWLDLWFPDPGPAITITATRNWEPIELGYMTR